MSYDVDLVIDTGRTCTDWDGTVKPDPVSIWNGNITYNLGDMMRAAGINLHDCHGMQPHVAAFLLEAAVDKMTARPAEFRAFNSPNGWGTYDDCLHFLQRFLQACRTHPTTTVHVS